MNKSITYTAKSKEKNPTQDPSRQINSLSIVAGRLLSSLIRERRINPEVEAKVTLSLETTYEGDIMENIVSLKITQIENNSPIPRLN